MNQSLSTASTTLTNLSLKTKCTYQQSTKRQAEIITLQHNSTVIHQVCPLFPAFCINCLLNKVAIFPSQLFASNHMKTPKMGCATHLKIAISSHNNKKVSSPDLQHTLHQFHPPMKRMFQLHRSYTSHCFQDHPLFKVIVLNHRWSEQR